MILMFTCMIRYVVDIEKLDEFERYAITWMRLIQKYGGIHHGYFLPSKDCFDQIASSFSFPDLGRCGPKNIAVAFFSFESIEKYEIYKRKVKDDDECIHITERAKQNPCFLNYERTFLQPLLPDNIFLKPLIFK